MHEFGQGLFLDHGGFEPKLGKPNYVSIMNYQHRLGIRQRGGGRILDFSPPCFFGGRGAAPPATLVEASLDEMIVLDVSDPSNRFRFFDPAGSAVDYPLDGDLDSDGVNEPRAIVNVAGVEKWVGSLSDVLHVRASTATSAK